MDLVPARADEGDTTDGVIAKLAIAKTSRDVPRSLSNLIIKIATKLI
jgi:hypothetical protein